MSPDKIFGSFGGLLRVLDELRDADRGTYRGAVAALAGRKRLRAVFLDKKPLPERHAWMVAELSRKSNEDIAREVLQGWLISCHKTMVIAFLEAVGAPHDGGGLIESLPPEPPEVTLRAAVEGLLEKFPSCVVAAYLNLFVEMDIADWPVLRKLVASEPRLQPTPA